MKWHLTSKRHCLAVDAKRGWGIRWVCFPGMPFSSRASALWFWKYRSGIVDWHPKVFTQQQSLQSVHLPEHLAVAVGAVTGIKVCWGEAGLIEPIGRLVASLSADDMVRTFQQKQRYVLGGSSSGLGSNHHSIIKYFQKLAGGKEQFFKGRFLASLSALRGPSA